MRNSVQQFIGPDEKGFLSLPDKLQFLFSDYVINTTNLAKTDKVVDEVVADDKDVSKIPLADKINIILANNKAQAEELDQIDQILEDTMGKSGYGSQIPRVSRIKILAERNDAMKQQLAGREK
jgi:hypothetical protein